MTERLSWLLVLAAVVLGCGSGPVANPCAASPGPCDLNATCTASGGEAVCACNPGYAGDGRSCRLATGEVASFIRVNNFGWRTADEKIAVVLGRAGAPVELRRLSDESVVATYTASGLRDDEDSGDRYATVDFTDFTSPGEYYLYVAAEAARSYPFTIADDVYDVVGAVAVKSYYYQRCNSDKVLPFASDALGRFAGIGGEWVDGACHAGDGALGPGPGSADDGVLDLSGGWHDAGDYQKTLWGRGVPEMLFAYEMNPGAWRDGQLQVPESGNGSPDILDEAKWELDFYLRMQRPDGHFLSSAKGRGGSVTSPPSASDEQRVYFDCTSPEGSGWSGGGVTLATATGNAVLSLAHAAIVFRAIGKTADGDAYAVAATKGWNWLADHQGSGAGADLVAAAASAVHRMDPTQATAGAAADAAWSGDVFGVTPAHNVLTAGAWHYLLDPGASAGVKAGVRAGIGRMLDGVYSEEGAYGGLFGGHGNGWDYSWGSNRAQGSYGSFLFMAARLGALSSHTSAEVTHLARKYAHYLMGLNPLNMVYMTSMAAYGGEHSSFQIYHGWFSVDGADGDHGNPRYNGKPDGVFEPLYPYYPDDRQTSTYGPAPGLVPGGPNFYYSGAYAIPNREFPAYAYRDFSTAWDDGRALSWEITEPMQAYQGPVVLLLSFLMSGG
jgi:hypothetical protein